jgi:hypothetical protein
MGTTGYEKCHTGRRKNMAEIEKALQEERGRCSGLAARHKVETRRRRRRRRKRRNVQVMVPEFRALHYSQLLGVNTLPIWSNKQLIGFLS